MSAAGAFILAKGYPREKAIQRLVAFLGLLGHEKSWRIEIAEQKSKRSLSQNAYLWGVVYPTIVKKGGETLAGWTNDDLHEYFLGEHFGWETISGFGRRRLRPIRRSSKLAISEFMSFVDFIQRRMAEIGVYIPSPNEQMEAAWAH